jgi:adenosine kinase
VLDRVGVQVTTLGKDGVRVQAKGAEAIVLPAAKDVTAIEPTGVGDAFRAGFLGALAWGLSLEHAAEVGCVLAAYVVETVGPQDYTFTAEQFLARLDASYGGEAADAVRPHLQG